MTQARPAFRATRVATVSGSAASRARSTASAFGASLPVVVLAALLAGAADLRAQATDLKATAATPLSPPDGTRFSGVPGAVTLVAEAAAGVFVPAAFDHRFEVYASGALFASSVVRPGDGDPSYGLPGPLDERTVYTWRVRAEFGGATGPWSERWSFETGSEYSEPGLRFADITVAAGLVGPPPVPLGGHGAAFADATGDGRPDLYVTINFADPVADQFFVNRGDGGFLESGASRGIADFDAGSHGAAWGDLDNDGDFDLFNGTTGTGAPNDVYRNDGGTFTDVTPPAVRARRESTRGVALLDMDRDGDLDAFAVSGWLGSGDPPGERNELYRNDGDLRFVSIDGGGAGTAPAGQGVTDTDFDGDGDIDLLAGNRDGNLVILRNRGGDFTLVDPGSLGITHRAYSGVTTADIDTDGDLDLLLVGLDAAGETVGHLYRNFGFGTFGHLRDFTNIDGYMGGFADLDHDGDLDLVFAGDDLVYLNDGEGSFSAGPRVPVDGIDDPRAIAFADIDGDGDPDFVVGVKRSRNWLIRNDVNVGSTNWLKIRLRSPHGQAGAFGAKLTVYPPAGGSRPIAVRESRSANGYLGQDDPVLHVGLGSHTRVDVVVTFIDGATRVLSGVTSNQTVTIDGSAGGNAPVFVERHR